MTTRRKSAAEMEGGLSRFLRREISGWELAERKAISNISILLTYQCPASCGHCVFQSDMTRSETVDRQTARTLILAAARQTPPPSFSFSGGEPFLQLALMEELAQLIHDQGTIWEVISSSGWCRSREHAREVLARFKALGLKTYCTSVDRFHIASVAPRRMRDAILAAMELGIKVSINTMIDRKTRGREKAWLARTLDLPVKTIARCQISPMYIAPVGRAETLEEKLIYREGDFREGCPFATEVVTLSPLGLLYPCCGMVVGEPPAKAQLFVQENLTGKSVDEVATILAELKNDLFFKLLQVAGPYRLLQVLKKREPDLPLRDRFVGSCDVCLEFTRNRRVQAATQRLLAEWGALLSKPD